MDGVAGLVEMVGVEGVVGLAEMKGRGGGDVGLGGYPTGADVPARQWWLGEMGEESRTWLGMGEDGCGWHHMDGGGGGWVCGWGVGGGG